MLRLFIILGFLLIVFSLFYIFVLDTTLKNEANRLAHKNHVMNNTMIKDHIDVLSQSYEDDTLLWETKTYDDTNLIPDALKPVEIVKLSQVFTDEISNDVYLILKHSTKDEVAFKKFYEVLSVIGLSFGQNGYIINSNGIIKYHINPLLVETNLFASQIYPGSVYRALDEDLSQKQAGFLNFKKDDQNFILSFTKLDDNYFYMSHVEQYAYLEIFTPVIWGFMSLSFLMILIFVIFGLLVVKRRFDDEIVFNKLTRTMKSSLLILEVGGLGQVRQANTLFKTLTSDVTFKTIADLTTEKIDMTQLLKNKQPFYIEMDKLNPSISVRFLINKYSRNYQLIGEIIDSSSNVLDKYRNLARTYPLTGLKNRLALEEMIETLDKKEKFSFIIMGIRALDEVAKSIGREKTNELVNIFIELIQSKMYPNMLLFQIDKNEFVVLQRKDPNYDVTVGWARQMIEAIDTSILLPDLPIKLQLDVGILHNRGAVANYTTKEMIDALEITLERATLSTTNNLMIFSERYLDFRNKASQLEKDIREGIKNDEFVMYMQPQYDLIQKRVSGFELLLRWDNPKYIKESPALYIKQAEKSNLIIDLGRMINEKVFQIAKKLEGKDIDISFNISPRQLMQPGFINELIALKDKYQVDPNKIAIELTETLLILQMDVITEKFNALKDLNFKIQLDDFGTGYSSLNYLKRLPIDNIKVDKVFVDEIETSAKSRHILKTIMTLGKNLSMGVIIEGVETEKQLEFIKKETNAIIQGFYISKALPEKEAFEFIRKKVNL